MTTLALDLGLTTGYAWRAAKGTIQSGTWDFKPGKYDGGGIRYMRFRERLNVMRVNNGLTLVVYEAVRRHLGTDAAHGYGGMMGTLTGFCEEHAIPYEGVSVQTIKKYWTGKGNAKKPAMIAQAIKLGYDPVDDNEADALALLHFKMGVNA